MYTCIVGGFRSFEHNHGYLAVPIKKEMYIVNEQVE